MTPKTFPSDLVNRIQWLTWKYTDDDPPRKVPRAPHSAEYRDKFVNAQDPDSWTDFHTARRYAFSLPGHELAFNIRDRDEHPDEDIVFVDFDNVRDPDSGVIHPTAHEYIKKANSFAQISTSGTGVHILCRGELPDDVKAIEDSLSPTENFPNPEIEVYDTARFIGMTGNHLEGTPTETREAQEFVDFLCDEHVTTAAGKPDGMLDEPLRDRDEIQNIDSADSIYEVFDAIQHVTPRDIRLRSEVTNERGDRSKSLDPSWAISESGTRLAQLEEGWVYRKGMVGLDALQVVALEEGIISDVSQYPSGEDFWNAVDALRDRGAHIPEFDPTDHSREQSDHDHMGVALPDDPHPDIDPEFGKTIYQEDIYNRVYDTIATAMEREDNILADAIMGAGKTYSSIKAVAEENIPGAYFAPRIDLYDQAKAYAIELGIPEDEILILPSMKRDCSTWQGEHGDEWAALVKKQYYRGAKPREIHDMNEDIPCHCDDEACTYHQKWQFEPDDYQLIIGHYKHSHIPFVTAGRTCFFDEEPTDAFQTRLEGGELIKSINTFLDRVESPPVSDFDELLRIRRDHPHKAEKALRWYSASEIDFDWEPDSAGVIRNSEEGEVYHAYAPHAVYAILKAEPVGGDYDYDFERSFLPGDFNDALFFTTNENYEHYYVELRHTPNMDYVRNVIALDGTPLLDKSKPEHSQAREWSGALGCRLHHRRILTDEERARYLEETMEHTYIQTSNYRKPYSSAKYHRPDEDAALLKGVTEKYGTPVVFTSRKVAQEYEERGFGEEGIVKAFGWPGAIRGTNKWADERVAVQLGSSHHGDHEIRRRAAWLRETIEVEGRGNAKDYGSPLANDLHRQMAENQTLQNILRVGRDGGGATVVIHTSAFPDWLPVHGEGRVDAWSEGMRQVHDAFLDLGQWRTLTGEIASHEAVEVGKRHVLNILNEFESRGLLMKRQSKDDATKVVWNDSGLGAIEQVEQAEYELPDIDTRVEDEDGLMIREREMLRVNIYTADFVDEPGPQPDGEEIGGDSGLNGTAGDTPPPDD